MEPLSDMIDSYFYTVTAGNIYANIIGVIDRLVVTKALERSFGNQVAAARMLGLHRNTLKNKIKKLNIDVGRFKK